MCYLSVLLGQRRRFEEDERIGHKQEGKRFMDSSFLVLINRRDTFVFALNRFVCLFMLLYTLIIVHFASSFQLSDMDIGGLGRHRQHRYRYTSP